VTLEDVFGADRRRISAEVRRRDAELGERCAPWQPGEIFMKSLRGPVRSVTLAPVLARAVALLSWAVATLLEALPFLRRHPIAVLRRDR
jgi:hypothetical protein